MRLDSLCRWQVSVYYARRIPGPPRCTHSSILLHLIDIGFLPYICLLQISEIQTWVLSHLYQSGHRLLLWGAVPAIHRVRIASFPKKTVIGPPLLEGRRCRHNLHSGLPERRDSSTSYHTSDYSLNVGNVRISGFHSPSLYLL